MRALVSSTLALLMLIALGSTSFAGNQQGKGSQASGSQSGITGQTGNQGNDKDVGNAGGTKN